jgi:hypothetical protein
MLIHAYDAAAPLTRFRPPDSRAEADLVVKYVRVLGSAGS